MEAVKASIVWVLLRAAAYALLAEPACAAFVRQLTAEVQHYNGQ